MNKSYPILGGLVHVAAVFDEYLRKRRVIRASGHEEYGLLVNVLALVLDTSLEEELRYLLVALPHRNIERPGRSLVIRFTATLEQVLDNVSGTAVGGELQRSQIVLHVQAILYEVFDFFSELCAMWLIAQLPLGPRVSTFLFFCQQDTD